MGMDVFFINLLLGHGIAANRSQYFDIVEKWFILFGEKIERRSGKSNESTKFINNCTFLNYLASTDECSFYSGESNQDTDLEFANWSIYANINFDTNSLIFAVDKKMTDMDEVLLLRHIISQAENLPVVYGYAFSDNNLTGLGYVMGLIFFDHDTEDDQSNELAEKTAKWSDALDEGKHFSKLRNIYPYNLISCGFMIEGVRFGEWIEANKIGVIEKIGSLDLWKLQKDETVKVLSLFEKSNKIWEM